MRKWEYIARILEHKEAPIRIIDAAKEIDSALLSLGLDNKQLYGPMDHGWENLEIIINDRSHCSACIDCNYDCNYCLLGSEEGCTPRNKHAVNYFKTVNDYTRHKAERSPKL